MRFILNGEEMVFDGDVNLMLYEYLQSVESLPVSKVACSGKGVCGACTVMLDGNAVLSCDVPMGKVADKNVFTADVTGQVIQDVFSIALRKIGTPECSYCVPDLIMTVRVFLEKNSETTFEEARRANHKNLCRCIGRGEIARSFMDAAEILRNGKAVAGNV